MLTNWWLCVCVCVHVLHIEYQSTRSTVEARTFGLVFTIEGLFEGEEMVLKLTLDMGLVYV